MIRGRCGTSPAHFCLKRRACRNENPGYFGGVHKMSTLVQWAEVKAIDTKTGRTVLDKLSPFAATQMKRGAGPKPLSRMSLRRLCHRLLIASAMRTSLSLTVI
jgi:hypothetical protein